MLRDLIKEGGLYTLAQLLTKGLSLLLVPFFTAYFSPTDYGVIDILVVFGTVLNSIVSLQLNQGLGRYVSDPDLSKENKVSIASTAIFFMLFGYVLITTLLILFPKPAIALISNDELTIPTHTFHLALASVSINGIFYILGVYLRFLRKSKPYAFLSFTHALANILLTLYLVLGRDMGIDGIYIASITITPIIIILQIVALKGNLSLKFSKEHLNKLLKFSLPLVPASLAYIVLNFTDRIFIKEFLSFDNEGIYGIGSRFASIVSIIILGFSSAMAPILYQNHKDDNYRIEMGRILRLFFAIGSTGVLALSLFSKEVLIVFTQEDYYAADTIMPYLYLSVFITGMGMFSPGMHLKEKTRYIPLIVIGAGAVNIGLNFLLITEFQLAGAAISTVISIFLSNYVFFLFSQHYYRIPIRNSQMIPFVLFFLIIWYCASFLLQHIELEMLESILVKTLIILVYFGILLKTKMISLKKLKTFLNR